VAASGAPSRRLLLLPKHLPVGLAVGVSNEEAQKKYPKGWKAPKPVYPSLAFRIAQVTQVEGSLSLLLPRIRTATAIRNASGTQHRFTNVHSAQIDQALQPSFVTVRIGIDGKGPRANIALTCRRKPLPLVARSPDRAYVESNSYRSLPLNAAWPSRFEPRRPP
jgi:hypothetical protein